MPSKRKQDKRRARAKVRRAAARRGKQQMTTELKQVWDEKGHEELTDELIAELIDRGWDRAFLEQARAEGYAYSKQRDSVFSPIAESL